MPPTLDSVNGLIDQRLLKPTTFSSLYGWNLDDHLQALKAFYRSAVRSQERPYHSRSLGVDGLALAEIANATPNPEETSPVQAKEFFEAHFDPYRVTPAPDQGGFVTGYFEPVVRASRQKSSEYCVSLYNRPQNLIDVNDTNRPPDMDPSYRFGRQASSGVTEFADRGQIQNGYLDGQGLELVWLRDKVEAFFIHVQGSAKLLLDDQSIMRVTYAAKTGHPYGSVAKILCQQLKVEPAQMTADRLADWMRAHPADLDNLLANNRSYIFFKEVTGLTPDEGPVAAAKTPLMAGRSLAVDRLIHTFGTPIWLETENPLPGDTQPFARLMVAQDTGSAIVGPARGDIFVGSGDAAGLKAGRIRHQASMVALVPKNNTVPYDQA